MKTDTPRTLEAIIKSAGQWSYAFRDTCEQLERELNQAIAERNELAQAILSLLEIGACVNRDEDIIENKRRREIARDLVKKLKEPKTNNVETTP